MTRTTSPKTTAPALRLHALAAALPQGGAAPTALRLVPAGEFRARDGRPADLPGWRLTARGAANILAHARGQATDSVIDYEHQTLRVEANGQPAPAAGWWSGADLTFRGDGEAPGLYATNIRWTDRARGLIEAGEYRYLSPVILSDPATGEVLAVPMAALTNTPGLDGLTDLSGAALSMLAALLPTDHPETGMDLTALRNALALADDAGEDAILAAVAALAARADGAAAQITALSADLTAARAAAPATSAPDPAHWVPRAVHEETVTALRALGSATQAAELDRMIHDGLADGRIPGQQTADWLRAQGVAAVRGYLAGAPAIAALTRQQVPAGKAAPEADGEQFTTALAAEFGSREAWEAWRKADAAGLIKTTLREGAQ